MKENNRTRKGAADSSSKHNYIKLYGCSVDRDELVEKINNAELGSICEAGHVWTVTLYCKSGTLYLDDETFHGPLPKISGPKKVLYRSSDRGGSSPYHEWLSPKCNEKELLEEIEEAVNENCSPDEFERLKAEHKESGSTDKLSDYIYKNCRNEIESYIGIRYADEILADSGFNPEDIVDQIIVERCEPVLVIEFSALPSTIEIADLLIERTIDRMPALDNAVNLSGADRSKILEDFFGIPADLYERGVVSESGVSVGSNPAFYLDHVHHGKGGNAMFYPHSSGISIKMYAPDWLKDGSILHITSDDFYSVRNELPERRVEDLHPAVFRAIVNGIADTHDNYIAHEGVSLNLDEWANQWIAT